MVATKVITCMNQCYEGDFIDNPYYMRQYGGDTPDFGPQDHSKKNNPLDHGLQYENFCVNPKPPVLDAPSPQIRQGADIGLEPKLSFDLLDTDVDMDITAGSNDLDPFIDDSTFVSNGITGPSENLFLSSEIASANPLDFDDSYTQGNLAEISCLASTESSDPEENLFLDPVDEGDGYLFASLDRRSSNIRDNGEGDLVVRNLPTSAVERRRKPRRQLSACV